MKIRARVLIAVAMMGMSVGAHAQTFHLTSTAFGSAGGAGASSSMHLGILVGQPIIGIGSGPSGMPRYAESVGFWRWGNLPVLDVEDTPVPAPILEFAVLSNSPNPSSGHTMIRYAIPTSAGPTPVTLRLYDASGRLVRVLDSGVREAGIHTADWDGRDESGQPVTGGVYFYRFHAGTFAANRRLVYLR